jgi:hypothetical protein
MSKTLFHYTPVYCAVLILRHGVIKRSTGDTPPYVWLTQNQTGEPTASHIHAESLPRRIFDDQRAFFAFQGWARFVFKGFNAISWQDLPLPDADRLWLGGLAKCKKSRPQEWSALIEDEVRCADLLLEVKTPSGWQGKVHDDLKREYEDMETRVGSDGLLQVFLPPHGWLRLGTETQIKVSRLGRSCDRAAET